MVTVSELCDDYYFIPGQVSLDGLDEEEKAALIAKAHRMNYKKTYLCREKSHKWHRIVKRER